MVLQNTKFLTYAGMRRTTTFRSTKGCIYDSAPIRLPVYYNVLLFYVFFWVFPLIKFCRRLLLLLKDGNCEPEINDRINKGRAAVTQLKGILWVRDVTPKTKTHIYHAIVKSTITYAAETWCLEVKTTAKLNSTEMDFWRRSAPISKKDKIRNNVKK
jgi:hypothetical protein